MSFVCQRSLFSVMEIGSDVPCSPDCVAAGYWLVLVAEHELSSLGSYAICADNHICDDPLTSREDNACLVIILEVLLYLLVKVYRDSKVVSSVVEDDLVQLAAVAVKHRCLLVVARDHLVEDNLASVVFMDPEAILSQVDAQRPQTIRDLTTILSPLPEDASRVGPERDDIAEDLELWERLVYFDVMPVAVTLYCRRETAEACTDDDDFDASLGNTLRHDSWCYSDPCFFAEEK